MIYLGTPYSHESQAVMYYRYRINMETAVQMLQDGDVVYSPIVHWHPVALEHALPKDFEFWRRFDLHILNRCSLIEVLQLPGWAESKGLRAEIEFAKQLFIPVHYRPPRGRAWERFRWMLEAASAQEA